LEAMDLTKDWR